MKRSTERILTTHAGRLPNPDNIAVIQKARADGDQATFDRLMQAGVADRVHKQMELRNDIHSDGEFWKARDELYYNSRVTGVEMRPLQPGEGASILVHQQERHIPKFREFYAIYDQIGNIPRPGVIAHKTTSIELPELVAHRIVRYANIMGRENVIAGTDCGYGNRVYPDIAWAKMKAMAEGATLATRQLWPRAG